MDFLDVVTKVPEHVVSSKAPCSELKVVYRLNHNFSLLTKALDATLMLGVALPAYYGLQALVERLREVTTPILENPETVLPKDAPNYLKPLGALFFLYMVGASDPLAPITSLKSSFFTPQKKVHFSRFKEVFFSAKGDCFSRAPVKKAGKIPLPFWRLNELDSQGAIIPYTPSSSTTHPAG